MKNLFNESGSLSDFGKKEFERYLDKEIKNYLDYASTENELRIIGSLIHKRVGDNISNYIQKLKG